jgi:hypothetical protein
MSQTGTASGSASGHTLGIDGTQLTLDGRPFPLTGVSFFNALYNPTFNQNDTERERWLTTFLESGVNTLRVWCQWDFAPPRDFIDTDPEHSMYVDDGSVRDARFDVLAKLLDATNALSMVVEVVLFSHEKRPNLEPDALERGARGVAERLRPYRNVILQLWNEDSTEWSRLFHAVK